MNTKINAPKLEVMLLTTAQKSPAQDTVAPASLAQQAPPRPPAPVTYCSTAVQTQPPHNSAEFEQQYGREAKLKDLEYKVGLAAIGRYKDPDHDPLGVVSGPPFSPTQKERNSTTINTSFQTMGFGASTKVLTKAKVKASITVTKYKSVANEAGYNIWAESKDDKVVHSEHLPVFITLDKEGNAPPDTDLTGRFLQNIYKEEIQHGSTTSTAPSEQAITPSLPWTSQTDPLVQLATSALLPWAVVRAPGTTTPRSIATLEPSLHNDWKPVEPEKVPENEKGLSEKEPPYASCLDAFLVFDPEHHVPREPARMHAAIPAPSRKRKDHSPLHGDEDQRELKRSRTSLTPPRSALLNSKRSIRTSLSLVDVPPEGLEHYSTHVLHTPKDLSARVDTHSEPREDHRKTFRATGSLQDDHRGTHRSSRSPSRDQSRNPRVESKSRIRHSNRKKHGRSQSPLGSGVDADVELRYSRKRDASRRRTADQPSGSNSPKTAQAPYESELHRSDDDTDPQESTTSSSTPSSHSTFATSHGSNESRPSLEARDEPLELLSSPAQNNTLDHAIKSGSPQPGDRARRAEMQRFMPRTQEVRRKHNNLHPTGHKGALDVKPGVDTLHWKERSLTKNPADRPQQGRKRSLDEFVPGTFVTLAEQERSKREKRDTTPTQKSKHNFVPSKDAEDIELRKITKITAEQPVDRAVVLVDAKVDRFPKMAAMINSKENKAEEAMPQSKTREVLKDTKKEAAKEMIVTDKVEKEMTEVQKKLAARRAKRAAQPGMGVYVPPVARRTNAAGNAPTPNQNRTSNHKNSGRESRK